MERVHPDPETVTRLIENVRAGDPAAVDALISAVHGELRELAAALFARERHGHTLQPTALVNEAWLRLAGHLDRIEDRVHFFAIASRVMRRVLVDHARGRDRQKRGGGLDRITFDERLGWANPAGIDFIELEDSLGRLEKLNERHARVVELRMFGGLTIAEAARILGVSHGTIESDWYTAKLWLRAELAPAR